MLRADHPLAKFSCQEIFLLTKLEPLANNPTMTTIEHPIRAWRRRKKITQEELCAAVGCSTSHLSLIEGGKHKLSVDLALRIVEKTGLRLTEVLANYKRAGE